MSIQTQLIRATALGLVMAVTLSAAAPLVTVAMPNPGPHTDHGNRVSEGEIHQALQYTPGLLETSTQVVATSDTDSAMSVATAGATIDIPKNANDGVTLASADGTSLDITLPNAEQSGTGQQVANGVVAYASNNGSANAVQADNQGGIRMLTIIDNPNAPTKYDYKVSVPTGGTIQLLADGGAVVVDNAGEPISFVGAPWAKDATGKAIKTWFTTDGSTLTQHVKHNVKGVIYPVTADPWWIFDYFGCILGIGVPIGAAVVIASFPPSWYWINRIAAGTAGSGRVNGLVNYAKWVKTRCSNFINN